MKTLTTTWLAQIVAVAVLLTAGSASASSGLLSGNSPLGKNPLEGGYYRVSASVSAETHQGCGEVSRWNAAGFFVAPRTQFPANESQLRHIFREAEGHIADTAANRALLQGVADDAGALLGADRFGNQWFARLNANGTQTWVQVRNGTIINGGVNQTPRTFNPGTGLSGGGS